jgi:hypothetical protein
MLKLTAEENGLHSLAKSLEAFQKLHDSGGQDKYALKEAILLAHHGAEALCKGVLYLINPALIARSEKNLISGLISMYTTRHWDFDTITLSEALERLHSLFGKYGFFEGDDYQQLKQACVVLQDNRNSLQHFQLEGDVQSLALVLGAFIPRLVDVLEKINKQENILHVIYPQGERVVDFLARRGMPSIREKLKAIYADSEKTLQLLAEDYDHLYKQAKDGILGLNLQNVVHHIKLQYDTFVAPTCEEKFDGLINFNIDSTISHLFARGFEWTDRQGDFESHRCNLRMLEHKQEPLSRPMHKITFDEHGVQKSDPFIMAAERHTFHVALEVETYLKNVINHLSLDENTPWLRFIKNMVVRTKADIKFSGQTLGERNDYLTDIKQEHISLEVQLQLIPNGISHEDVNNHLFCTLKPKITKLVKFEASFRSWDGFSKDSLRIDLNCETSADVCFSKAAPVKAAS